MDLAAYERYSAELEARLRADPRVFGLVALGSYADEALRDQWSDHDFLGDRSRRRADALLDDLAYCLMRRLRHRRVAPHYHTLLYHNGHQVGLACSIWRICTRQRPIATGLCSARAS